MVLLISYDLNNHERPAAYRQVAQLIEAHALSFRRPLYSQWLVETQDAPDVWSERLKIVTDSDDSWLVLRVQRPYQGWLPKEVWSWLAERL